MEGRTCDEIASNKHHEMERGEGMMARLEYVSGTGKNVCDKRM